MPVPVEPQMLAVRLLGERSLWSGDRDISASIHYRKGWALLGYLAVEHGRRHPREELAQLFWPGLEPGSARTNLRQVLADLNQALGGGDCTGVIQGRRDSIGLFPQPGTVIDVLTLEAIEAAVAGSPRMDTETIELDSLCFGGEFLQGLILPDCEDFEIWLQLARCTFVKRTEAVLTRLCDVQRASNRVPQAIATARQLVLADEWNERSRRLLMELLAASGLHAQALQEYEALRASLAAELASEPEARTQALSLRIEADRRRGPALDDGTKLGFAGDVDSDPVADRTVPISMPMRAPTGGWVEVVHGVGQGTRLPITSTPLLIGRSRDSDLYIDHETVSRHHCTIWCDGTHVRIRDLGSTNRTRVNDASVEEAELNDGDTVVLGETMLRFVRGCD